jgi:hypothetical protein
LALSEPVCGPDRPEGSTIVSRYVIYGITLETAFDFEWPVVADTGFLEADVRFDCVDEAPIDVAFASYPPVHMVAVEGDEDRPDITYHRLPELDVVRIRGAGDHYIWPDRIVCHLHDPEVAYLVEIQLLGLVLAVWLERRGIPALHASAVVLDGSAVAFLGVKGGGKTTAATGMVASGASLLADDLLAVTSHGADVYAHPGYPMLRLWPEQADHFVGEHSALPQVHPSYSKRRVVVGERFGSFHARPAPLRCLYLPMRDVAADEVSFEPLRDRDALLAMVQESFLRDAVHGLKLAAGRLPALAAVVERIAVRTVRYPSGFDRLPQLAEAVAADVAALSPTRPAG